MKILVKPEKSIALINLREIAHLWTTYQLCLNSNPPPCGHCQSCDLNSQHTHPDSHYYDQPNSIDQIRHFLQKLHTTTLSRTIALNERHTKCQNPTCLLIAAHTNP